MSHTISPFLPSSIRPLGQRSDWLLAIILALAAITISVGGVVYYRHQAVTKRAAAIESLQTIADLKANQLSNWIRERRGDAELASSSAAIHGIIEKAGSADARLAALRPMATFRKVYGYRCVIVTDAQGQLLLKDPEEYALQNDVLAERIQAGLHSPGVELSDLTQAPRETSPHLWLTCPVVKGAPASGTPDGALVLVIDPRDFLFPTVRKWPTPTRTAEALIVLQEGDQIVYLNEPRFRSGAPPNLPLPAGGKAGVPAGLAVNGAQGIAEGPDYRGVPVLAVSRKIPDMPWYLVAKMDEEEIFAPLRHEAWTVGLVTGLLAIATSLGIFVLWRSRNMEALRENAVRLHTLIEQAPMAIQINRNAVAVYANQKFLEMFAIPRLEDVVGRPIGEQWTPEWRPIIEKRARQRMAGMPVPSNYEAIAQRYDGTSFQAHLAVTVVGLPDGPAVLAFLTDITERKRIELHINRVNRLYAVLSSINTLIVRERNPERILEGACRIAVDEGNFRMAWIGMIDETVQVVNPVASAGFVDGYLAVVNIDLKSAERSGGPMGQAVYQDEHQICNDLATDPLLNPWRESALKRGYRSVASFPLRVEGKVVGAFGLYSAEVDFFDSAEVSLLDELAGDIGFALEVDRKEIERKQAEKNLRSNEERFRLLIENASDIVMVINGKGVMQFVGPSVQRSLGYEPEHLLNRNMFDFIDGDDAPRIEDAIAQLLADPTLSLTFEYRIHHWNGSWRVLESVAHNLADRSADGYIVVNSRDITESRRLADQLRQAQKMEAIGQLAGGVAHDFNNILGAIMMQAQLAIDVKDVPEETEEGLRQILVASGRAAKIISQLLLFSRKEVMQARDLNLNEVAADLSKMLQRFIGEDIRLQLHLAPVGVVTHADPGMVDQILLNLCVNARDAMPGGGTLLIETGNVLVDEAFARRNPDAKPGPYAWLSVSDTGTGIPPEVMPRIFEPFFTTKEPGKGTGLGLATVFGTVKQHGGFLTVESEMGRGTRFQIYFVASEASGKFVVPAAKREPKGGSETILLVEDDVPIRSVMSAILERKGYNVIEANDGPQALRLWREQPQPPALLITDLVMPSGLHGHQLAMELRRQCAELKVIMMSGYSADIAGKKIDLKAGEYFLKKPFSPDRFLGTVRQILDGEAVEE